VTQTNQSLTIHLVRHGETDWNAESRLQGWADIPLNQKGLAQAQATAASLASRPLARVISSDLTRARQTAEPIAARVGLEVDIEPALRERRYGVAEGRTHTELALEFGDQLDEHWADPDFSFEGGETRRDVYIRLSDFLRTLLAQPAAGELVLVSHGGALRAARGFLEGIPLEELPHWEFHNGQITTVSVEPDTLLQAAER
jgi:2,3-bisphosphoglycerate-dependent phosphoglycerate mutase